MVLSSQVNAGQLQLERKEIQVVCITFYIWKQELVNHDTNLLGTQARLPYFFTRYFFHVLLLYRPGLRLVKGEWKMLYYKLEESLPWKTWHRLQTPEGSGICYNSLKISWKISLWKMGYVKVRFFFPPSEIMSQTWKKNKDDA